MMPTFYLDKLTKAREKPNKTIYKDRFDPETVLEAKPRSDILERINNYKVIDKRFVQLTNFYNSLGEYLLSAKSSKNRDLQLAMKQKLDSIKSFKNFLQAKDHRAKRKMFEYFQGSSVLREDPFMLSLVQAMQVREDDQLITRVKRLEDVTSDGFQLSSHNREINRRIYETGEFLNYTNL